MSGLDLDLLREVSARRRDRWHTPDTEPWTGALGCIAAVHP